MGFSSFYIFSPGFQMRNCREWAWVCTHPCSEMEITKNKNPQARLQIFYRFLNPYPRLQFSLQKSQTFVKSLQTFGLRIFILRFLKSIGWYGFSYRFLVFFEISFIKVLFKVIANLKFYKRCFIKDDLQKHFCITGWCLVRHRNPYRLGPMD